MSLVSTASQQVSFQIAGLLIVAREAACDSLVKIEKKTLGFFLF